MSLVFNMLSRFVITFLPRSKRLSASWLQSPFAVILEPRKMKSVPVSIVSSSVCREVMGLDAIIFIFWVLNFKPAFSLSSFTFIKRLFSSSSLSVIRVLSSAYLRLLIFLLVILIPACASYCLAFHMLYFTSVQFSCSVVSDSLQSLGLQHTRPPCPSPTPRVYSNTCPLSQWYHPSISSSVVPFSSYPQSFPASQSFPMSQYFSSGGQSTGVSASTSVLLMNIQD